MGVGRGKYNRFTAKMEKLLEQPWMVKPVLLAIAYAELYLGSSVLIGKLFKNSIDTKDLVADSLTAFLGFALPVIIGPIMLLIFVRGKVKTTISHNG